jgi:CBS domain-containing protein
MTIGELCSRNVVIAESHESAAAVAALMASHHVGSIVIVDGVPDRRVPVGIVTDRDLALTIVAGDRSASQTAVARVMTPQPYVAQEDQDVYEVLHQMRARGLRRVPVVDRSGFLQGIFTFDDLVELTAEHMLHLTQLVQREFTREGSRPRPG